MSLCAWWPSYFAITKDIILFKIYFKGLVLRFEIVTFCVTPVLTALILLLLFQIIKIRCFGFAFTNFSFFLTTTTNVFTTTGKGIGVVPVVRATFRTLGYFLFFSFFELIFPWQLDETELMQFRSRILMLCFDNEKQIDKNTFKDNSQSEYVIY